MRTWLITGASRGLGSAFAHAALERGDAVVATAREPDSIQLGTSRRLLVLRLDVADRNTIDAAVSAALDRFARIDVLINNAGRGLAGAVEEASEQEVRTLFEVNVFGLLAVTKAVLPSMRRQESGTIVNVGSVGGFAARAGGGIYAATKFAIEGITEALHQELSPLGIHAMVVEPGSFRTGFLDLDAIVLSERVIDAYAQTAGRFRDVVREGSHSPPGDPDKAADVVIDAATAPTPPMRLPLGADALSRIDAKLRSVESDLAAWRERASATDFGS